ncbi:hypothetical protein CKM354_000889900 [Cercospora kikuchii]|uniref:ABC transporter domain-containing protein n=1 Tax=Cercospora kikuchii TaxID=84275 RepID=A0A9P3CNA0_9PEZI|nr:uncharacterized protein CKM354_000889900 [Cercospora kikuchii]GIZ45746.1 hypothetical protein CKM354_000889900 [Cercospora kikuchii]
MQAHSESESDANVDQGRAAASSCRTKTVHSSMRDKSSSASIAPGRETEPIELALMGSKKSHDDRNGHTETAAALDTDNGTASLTAWLETIISAKARRGVANLEIGIVFRNLDVFGSHPTLQQQDTVSSVLLAPLRRSSGDKRQILKDFHGYLRGGELLIALGRPGSGCSTLLKTLCSATDGLSLGKKSLLHYNGVSSSTMHKHFRGEVLYNQELDKHFPHLIVQQTLELAASYRCPAEPPNGMTRTDWIKFSAKVIMSVYGLSHTANTKVGSDFVRGVSGGERKRVSIAEITVSDASIAAWDNSTRGLDSATALDFIKSLRTYANLGGTAHVVAAYQASQAIYNVFDKVVVLYEGRQIYFGPTRLAKQYFEDMGWKCPTRQTTSNFLTAITNPSERRPRPGMRHKVPRTADEFEQYWHRSNAFAKLQKELDEYEETFPPRSNDEMLSKMQDLKQSRQSKHADRGSPYTISVMEQITISVKRSWMSMIMDKNTMILIIATRIIQALIVGSIFYGTKDATQGFNSKAAVLLFTVLLNALVAMAEISTLYAQRPIIEKHKSYAFYRPFTAAVADFIVDLPYKLLVAIAFNVIVYFLGGLRREAAQFFVYLLFSYITTVATSALFRTIAASTKTSAQAMAIGGVIFPIVLLYTGFMLPVPYMKDWFKWLHWLNPVYYAFEAIVANEFHGRQFTCSNIVPAYADIQSPHFVCDSQGARPGRWTVSGDDFIQVKYGYSYSHVWRNLGILCAFGIGFLMLYFVAIELNSSITSGGEILLFRRGHSATAAAAREDEESKGGKYKATCDSDSTTGIPPQQGVLAWKDVTYDVEVHGQRRRLLDHVAGWVKPGTLTALMGASGAGKTTLLDVLAQRVRVGVVSGQISVNGRGLDSSFARKTGYVQQQDLHLSTATVRESLRFSAVLRQHSSVPLEAKHTHVEEVIRTLGMESFAEAIVGEPGHGLNVEQRKRLTIGVELAAKPELLLFLDEPTSGLDSQSAWEIASSLRKLADSGQAILCTIHQPSAVLFETFDRLLLLAPGGKIAYFGELGQDSGTLREYFERHGAPVCEPAQNPAEYMLEALSTGPAASSAGARQDWHDVWLASPEHAASQKELEELLQRHDDDVGGRTIHDEFAMPFQWQLYYVCLRVFQQYWRSPSYIWSKLVLGALSGLFIGFSFYDSSDSIQGIQNVIFSVFGVSAILSPISEQILPFFVAQRTLYEVRERPARTYSWKAFLIANIVVEIPYMIVAGILVYACFYFPLVGATQSPLRQGLVLLYCIQFFVYASSFSHLIIAAISDSQAASAVIVLLFSMMLSFNGVLQTPAALPGFWIFMYRVSPLTYWVGGIVATVLYEHEVHCAPDELSIFDPPPGQTCGEYLEPYLAQVPGQLVNPSAAAGCRYCGLSTADQLLAASEISWTHKWRNFGLVWAYVMFNIAMATLLYYMCRVKRWQRRQ